MRESSNTDTELFILRTHIEIRLLHLGVDSRLRRRIVKAIARIPNVHKLSLLAYELDNTRTRMHEDP